MNCRSKGAAELAATGRSLLNEPRVAPWKQTVGLRS